MEIVGKKEEEEISHSFHVHIIKFKLYIYLFNFAPRMNMKYISTSSTFN